MGVGVEVKDVLESMLTFCHLGPRGLNSSHWLREQEPLFAESLLKPIVSVIKTAESGGGVGWCSPMVGCLGLHLKP